MPAWPLVALVVIAVAAGGAGIAWRIHQAEARSVRELRNAASAYLADWSMANWTAMRSLVADPPPEFTTDHQQVPRDLHVAAARYSLGTIASHGDTATAAFDARLALSGLGEWPYRGRLNLIRREGRWWVRWSPQTVQPALRAGLHLVRTREWAGRAPILARDGTPLTVQGQVVVVGVQPSRIKDRPRLLEALRRYAGADPNRVAAQLDAPTVKPNWFVPVARLSKGAYEQVKAQLYPVPGTVFRTQIVRTLRSAGFATHVVGSTGQITAELLQRLGAPYQSGDVVGLSGLELASEKQLAGQPSGAVGVADVHGLVLSTLFTFPGVAPQALRSTIDVRVQQAAEHALEGVTKPAALVALDAPTGELRAVVSRPVDGFNRAMLGEYPPGSTFKIVTSGALLANRMSLDHPVTCPPHVTAGGRSFGNFEGEALGTITFREAFEKSCNTAFIQMAQSLGADDLQRAAEGLGFNSDYSLPLPVGGGTFPPPSDGAERAAAAIGQGRVLASPVQMATVAAAVAAGAWHAPRLVSTQAPGTAVPLDPRVAASLRQLMRLVVTGGTGLAANVPGREVFGKTGTAQFGDGSQTHAWFVGFSGRLAFAVLVEGGGVGGQAAAPIAARFLEGL